jgi:glycosyltransferase involved in cell wall biosynthesis
MSQENDQRALRTLHLNTEPTWRGGEAQTLLLLRGLREAGHVADLVCPPQAPLGDRARQEGVRIVPMRLRGEVDILSMVRLRRLLRRGAYDLIHAHTSHAHTLAALAAARLGVGVVVSRRVDFSIYRRSFLGLNGIKYRYGFDVIVAVSQAIKDVLVNDGVRPELIRVVRSGVDPDRFTEEDRRAALPADLPIPPGSLLVLNTAHLTPHKGQLHLIRAFARVVRQVPQAFLCIAGQGELREELQEEIDRLGLGDRALLPGFRKDVGALLANATVYVMPSVEEGLGTAVLDAFLMEAPVVASRAGGLPEMVEDGRNGLLAEPGDAEGLASCILRLLKDDALRRTLAAAGRQTALDRFTYRKTVAETMGVYHDVLRERQQR